MGTTPLNTAVDTTHDSQSDKAALMMFSRLKGYDITGTAWVLKDANCVLQYSVDYAQESKDGKASKTALRGHGHEEIVSQHSAAPSSSEVRTRSWK